MDVGMADEASASSSSKYYNALSLSEEPDVEDFHDEPAADNGQDEEEPVARGLGSREDGYDESARIETEAEHLARTTSSSTTSSAASRLWNACLLPDDRFSIAGVSLVDGPPAVKLLKFVVVTLGSICLMYKGIRFVDWEHKRSFTLEGFWTYESTQVVSDTVVFFTVGRLWKQRGTDQISFLLTLLASNVFMSYLPNFKFLQASVSLYAMHCRWSWKLWMFVATLIPLVMLVVFRHVHYAVRKGVFARKMVELIVAFCLWFLPYISSPYFHLHHWFAGWWVGMHANFGDDAWWSRMTMAWCWGMYINGIAAYGRDPVLTCGYALFVSTQNRCPFLDCYVDGLREQQEHANDHTFNNATFVQPMVKPDWRNCTADAYHP